MNQINPQYDNGTGDHCYSYLNHSYLRDGYSYNLQEQFSHDGGHYFDNRGTGYLYEDEDCLDSK